MKPLRIYVPQDTSACALGADEVVKTLLAITQDIGLTIDLIRNGSRGLFYLEPLLEVETEKGRFAFGPMSKSTVPALVEALQQGKPETHSLYLGFTEEISFLSNQQRLTFARAGIHDPLDIDSYQLLNGFVGLKKALSISPQAIVDTIKDSGLRGRGGAAFPAGIKWQTVLSAPAEQKYIVCNADEGDSGTFADRLLMESDPFQVIEGMTIAALAVGATEGYIYLRSEYPKAYQMLNSAIELACEAGFLGTNICGSSKTFNLKVRLGAGAYICGEETALLNSLEGKRGMVRTKPPLPAIEGFLGQPTIVNNVLTLAAATTILAQGSEFYSALGQGLSTGTLAIQLAGNIKQGGLIEVPFGLPLRSIIYDFGVASFSGRTIKTVQVGGPLGAYVPEKDWDSPMTYEAFSGIGAMLGHGGVVVFDDNTNMMAQARFAMEFCSIESCGKCTPCRIGAVRGVEVIDKIASDRISDVDIELLNDLCDVMEKGSLCAMGGMTPFPVRSALRHYRDDFGSELNSGDV